MYTWYMLTCIVSRVFDPNEYTYTHGYKIDLKDIKHDSPHQVDMAATVDLPEERS